MAEPLLELRNVSLSFGGLKVVSDLDIEVVEREIVSVIGPNGAGKTTVFNLITGIFHPDSGEIVFEDRKVSGATRLILLGALLVVIMNVRPAGIFGTSRVEIV